MVQKIFNVVAADVENGYMLVDKINPNKFLPIPTVVMEDLTGKYMAAQDILAKIDTIQIALAGVTDSLNIVDNVSLMRRSVVKTFALKPSDTIDDEIEGYIESIDQYEQYHTIRMIRDENRNIKAVITHPTRGDMPVKFDESLMLNARRNNIKYWVNDYKVEMVAEDAVMAEYDTFEEWLDDTLDNGYISYDDEDDLYTDENGSICGYDGAVITKSELRDIFENNSKGVELIIPDADPIEIM